LTIPKDCECRASCPRDIGWRNEQILDMRNPQAGIRSVADAMRKPARWSGAQPSLKIALST
jgi:hypothetical protein